MVRAILFDILAPILLLILLGVVMRRKFAVDIGTLSKLNIYLFVPAFIFDVVSRSKLSWAAMGGVMLVTALQVLALGVLVLVAGRLLRVHPKTLAAVALAVMFYNSGNYGLPLATLAFPAVTAHGTTAAAEDGMTPHRTGVDAGAAGLPARPHPPTPSPAASLRDGAAVQAFVVFSMNMLTFTVGLAIAAWAGSGSWTSGAWTFLRLPMLPVIVAALLARWWLGGAPDRQLPIAIAATTRYLADGLVPLALVTLGAQLAHNPRWPRWRPLGLVLILRLLVGPLLMALMLYGFHRLGWPPLDLWPWPAASLVLTAAVPTAVNTLLMVLEVGGEADLAADAVFWTTVGSCVTIPAWLVVVRLATG
jgi:predicted permease